MRGEADIPEPGTLIAGKYRVERTLGSGGMGVVLAVRHNQLEELYALKLMLPAAAASSAARERFAREARAAAKLRSDHVARAIDFGFLEQDGPPYMVLELLTGENLAERLLSGGPVEPRLVATWMLQACDALREAHEDGIIHRDLKPSNLFLARRSGDDPSLKVLDFGIAKTIAADASALTKTATTMGSPFYMSPEQMRSAKNADARSDIWSLGVTMYELTTGRVPFGGDTVTEVAIAVIECAVESPRVHRPDLPEELERIVMRCLEKQPARRYPSVDQLAEALASFSGGRWSPRAGASIDAHVAPTSLPADPLASTEASSTGDDVSASQAQTIAASPALTLLGSSSRDGASSTPADAAAGAERSRASIPPAGPSDTEPAPALPSRRARLRLVAVGIGTAAVGLAGWLVFQTGPDAQAPAATAPADAAGAMAAAVTSSPPEEASGAASSAAGAFESVATSVEVGVVPEVTSMPGGARPFGKPSPPSKRGRAGPSSGSPDKPVPEPRSKLALTSKDGSQTAPPSQGSTQTPPVQQTYKAPSAFK